MNLHKKRSSQELLCDLDRIQTCNLLIRSQMLYSVELRGRCRQRFRLTSAKVRHFFIPANYFAIFFKIKFTFLFQESFIEHKPSQCYAGIYAVWM